MINIGFEIEGAACANQQQPNLAEVGSEARGFLFELAL
jgi:hypothetical protein